MRQRTAPIVGRPGLTSCPDLGANPLRRPPSKFQRAKLAKLSPYSVTTSRIQDYIPIIGNAGGWAVGAAIRCPYPSRTRRSQRRMFEQFVRDLLSPIYCRNGPDRTSSSALLRCMRAARLTLIARKAKADDKVPQQRRKVLEVDRLSG